MGKGCKKGGGTETRKTDTTGQRTHNKESMEDALEQRNELERKNGGGGKDCKKEKTLEQRTHNKESTEDAQEATHENTSYILRWKQGRQGKDGAPTG